MTETPEDVVPDGGDAHEHAVTRSVGYSDNPGPVEPEPEAEIEAPAAEEPAPEAF